MQEDESEEPVTIEVEYIPAEQEEQVDNPDDTVNVPEAQAVQTTLPFEEYEPAPQLLQVEAPATDE